MAYGGEFCSTHTTTTVDISGAPGYNDGATKPDDYANMPHYTRCMNGTSAATPEAAGAVALLLEANPALTWRDVRLILASTARKNDPSHADWVTNGGGYKVNHDYGYGSIDATAAVRAAQTWQNMAPQQTSTQAAAIANGLVMTDNGAATVSTLALTGSGIGKIEFVDVNLTTDHPDVGDLEIILTSPAGTASTLSVVHACKDSTEAPVTCGDAMANGIRFGVARLMGEAADGTWTLSVRDGKEGNTGTLSAWGIKVYGY
jgi:kexin